MLEPESDAANTTAVSATRRSTTAARLKAIYGDTDSVDAFTGMISEPHVTGTEFGELQLAMWTTQFQALRDGDRFFYGNDPVLASIAENYGVDYRRTLGDVIADNTGVDPAELQANVFLTASTPTEQTLDADSMPSETVPDDDDPPAAAPPQFGPGVDRRRPPRHHPSGPMARRGM